MSDILSSLEDIHEPTGDEELTIDLDFGSDGKQKPATLAAKPVALAAIPTPVRPSPSSKKQPQVLREKNNSSKNKNLAEAIAKVKSNREGNKKRKSQSLGNLFDENLNDRAKSPQKKALKDIIIKQEVIELSSDDEPSSPKPGSSKLGGKRHLSTPDVKSKKQKLEKELTVSETCKAFENMESLVSTRKNPPIFKSIVRDFELNH